MTSLLQTAAAFAVMISLCVAADQKKDEKPTAEAAKPAATSPAKATPATGPAAETAVTVNGKVITEAQVDEIFEAGTQGQSIPADRLEMAKRQSRTRILDILIDDQLLDPETKKENIVVTKEEQAKKIQDDMDNYVRQSKSSPEDMAKMIKQRYRMELKDFIAKQSTDPFYNRMLRRSELIEKRYPDEVKVSDAEIKESYEKNLETRYKEPAKVRASHILFGTKNKPEAEKAAAKKKAEEVLAEVKKPGADFAALAKQYSDCPSKENGGDLNFFPRERAMVEPFAAAAFAMKVGEISDVVETEFGYHIIKVTDRREAGTTSLEEATPAIRDQLRREKVNARLQQYTEELRKQAKIEYPKGKEPATQPTGMGMMQPSGARPAVRPTVRPATRPTAN
jgi:peptidyl-prolyl cis-trans isomerase C